MPLLPSLGSRRVMAATMCARDKRRGRQPRPSSAVAAGKQLTLISARRPIRSLDFVSWPSRPMGRPTACQCWPNRRLGRSWSEGTGDQVCVRGRALDYLQDPAFTEVGSPDGVEDDYRDHLVLSFWEPIFDVACAHMSWQPEVKWHLTQVFRQKCWPVEQKRSIKAAFQRSKTLFIEGELLQGIETLAPLMFLQIGEQNSLTAAIFCKTSPPRRNSILANFWTAVLVQVIYARACVGEILCRIKPGPDCSLCTASALSSVFSWNVAQLRLQIWANKMQIQIWVRYISFAELSQAQIALCAPSVLSQVLFSSWNVGHIVTQIWFKSK